MVLDQLAVTDGSPAATGAVVGDLDGIQRCMVSAMHDVLVSGADPEERFSAATVAAQSRLDGYNATVLSGGKRHSPRMILVS